MICNRSNKGIVKIERKKRKLIWLFFLVQFSSRFFCWHPFLLQKHCIAKKHHYNLLDAHLCWHYWCCLCRKKSSLTGTFLHLLLSTAPLLPIENQTQSQNRNSTTSHTMLIMDSHRSPNLANIFLKWVQNAFTTVFSEGFLILSPSDLLYLKMENSAVEQWRRLSEEKDLLSFLPLLCFHVNL